GVRPHFVDARTGAVVGSDARSTIDTGWLLAGALWAAEFLRDRDLEDRAARLYRRVDWSSWTAPHLPGPPGLLRHGQDRRGRFLASTWDRLNGETVLLYVLAAGADGGRAPASSPPLRPFYGEVAGRRFNNADLGLFVFQYGLDLLDLRARRAPGGVDLMAEAAVATAANQAACRALAGPFATYRSCWGLSAGDGPGEGPQAEAYRPYGPSGPIDGTAHVTATLASVAHRPEAVLENLRAARRSGRSDPLGRYGYSNLNIDRRWVGRDLVGIDAGAVVLALDNVLMADRAREVFHRLPCVPQGLDRLGFGCMAAVRRAS
ncbi:MAG TPA: glucoamylase family protein, partial [Isosphaeraceae bacterium]